MNDLLQNIAEELYMKAEFFRKIVLHNPNIREFEMNERIEDEWETWRYLNR